MNNNIWIWGYVMDKVPEQIPFVSQETNCSLETAATYIQADNAVFMNSTSDMKALNDDLFQYMKNFNQVVCGLEHGKYVESAKAISRFSKTHSNITGAILDDFRSLTGPSVNMSAAELKDVYEALKSENSELKLYLVRYSFQDQHELIPFLKYFDVINYWNWVSSDYYWRSYGDDIVNVKAICGKPILQGTFIHDYGDSGEAIPMNMLKLQSQKIAAALKTNTIDGWIILQNGWFCMENHREQIQWLKDYLDWFRGTHTSRSL